MPFNIQYIFSIHCKEHLNGYELVSNVIKISRQDHQKEDQLDFPTNSDETICGAGTESAMCSYLLFMFASQDGTRRRLFLGVFCLVIRADTGAGAGTGSLGLGAHLYGACLFVLSDRQLPVISQIININVFVCFLFSLTQPHTSHTDQELCTCSLLYRHFLSSVVHFSPTFSGCAVTKLL